MSSSSLKTPLRVGSRASALAQIQVQEVLGLLRVAGRDMAFHLTTYATQGDKDQVTSLLTGAGDDFFTDTLDTALLKGEIDLAVHSAKDVPTTLRPGLELLALTAPLDERDAFVGRMPWAQLPPGSRIGTSSLLRQKALKETHPNLVPADIRGTIEQRLRQLDDGKYDGLIIAACALKRLGLEARITDILPWEAAPLQGQLAVIGRAGDAALRDMLSAIDIRRTYGRVTLVGAGPGDPELITLKGVRALHDADCVFYDYLVHPALLEHAPRARKIFAGKRKGLHSMPQSELCRRLRQEASAGRHVVRLKGGDPFIFARGAEEMQYLRDYHIPVDVVPGVSSATGIAASLGVPLTARGIASSVALVSGHGDGRCTTPTPIRVPDADTVVFLMGFTRLREIVAALRAAGRAETTPMLLIARGTRWDQQVVRGELRDIEARAAKAALEQPVLIIVGETVRFYQESPRPRVLFLGTRPEVYAVLGQIIPFPMIEIAPAALSAEDEACLRSATMDTDLLLFTSPYGVRYFFSLCQERDITPGRLRAAAIGEESARELNAWGIRPLVTAREETSPGMLEALESALALPELRILFPRSALPNPFLKTELTRRGAVVRELVVYTNTKPARRDLPDGPFEQVVFTSPSTVRHFLEDYGFIPPAWRIIAKGKTTSDTLKAQGYNNVILFSDLQGRKGGIS